MKRNSRYACSNDICRKTKMLSAALLLMLSASTASAQERFNAPVSFCPQKKEITQVKTIKPQDVELHLQDGGTLRPADFTKTVSLNGTWKCSGLTNSKTAFDANIDMDKGFSAKDFDDSKWDDIDVPLDWYRKYPKARSTDKSGKSQNPYVKGWYRKTLNLAAEDIKQKRVLLHFGVIGYEARLFVNGKEVGSHHGDFTPWNVDITEFVTAGKNALAIRVFSDFGNVRGSLEKVYHTYGSQWSIGNVKGGIWQDVSMTIEPQIRFDRALVNPNLADSSITVDYVLSNPFHHAASYSIKAIVHSAMQGSDSKIIGQATALAPTAQVINNGSIKISLDNPTLWTPEKPYLYYLTICATMGDKNIASTKTVRFGLRDFKAKGRDFYLNGEKIYLFGENISSIGHGGFGITDEEEYENLRKRLVGFKELGYNIIRNAHMPILPKTLEIADEVGLMIYDEWAWSFDREIIEDKFEEHNLKEIHEWVYRDYNHPSVVMWSCGNEVVFKLSEAVARQLDKQVVLVRELDKSKRPVGTFSGSGSWGSYGKARRESDFIDLHSYIGLSNPGWTMWEEKFEEYFDLTQNVYADDGKFNIPYIIWECVGFSWGQRSDKNFTLNDISKYAKYAAKPTTWGQPLGIGFAGVIGLDASLDKDRCCALGRKIYGKRIIEQIRYDTRVQGFAPWFHDYSMQEAMIWTQPVICGLRSEICVPLRNVFAGREYEQEFFMVNSSNDDASNLKADIFIVTADGGKEMAVASVQLPDLPAWQKHTQKINLRIPAMNCPSRAQLRIVLWQGEKEISRNFYNLYIQSEKITTTKLQPADTIAVFKADNEKTTKLLGILDSLGVKYDQITTGAQMGKYKVVIIPPEIDQGKCPAPATLLSWVKNGGKLLELEQNRNGYDSIDQSSVIKAPQTFVDLVIPEHPIFRDLDQKAFDTWNNPDHGYSVIHTLSPFSINALATRIGYLGQKGVSNAITESAFGKGRILQSQMAAIEMWNTDSAATTYMKNLLEYVLVGQPYAKAMQLELKRNAVTVCPERMFTVDLTQHVNRSFTDEKANDGKGGWTDQGDNNFSMMPLGKYEMKGLTFDIIDPAQNNGKSCIVLKGEQRRTFPAEAIGIPVGKPVSRLFFLHACAWGGNNSDAGYYQINYEDGSSDKIELACGVNTADWWSEPNIMEKAFPAIRVKNKANHEVCLFLTSWDNPDMSKTVKSIDMISAGGPVPILVAISGEAANPEAVVIDNGEDEKKWSKLSWLNNANSGENLPTVTTVKRSENPNDVFAGNKATKIILPAENEKGQPVTFAHFKTDNISGTGYRYLSFWVKPMTYAVVEIKLPVGNWEKAFSATFPFGARNRGQWQKVRLSLTEDMGMGKDFDAKDLRGELFIYSAMKEEGDSLKPMEFILDELTLE